MAFDPSAVNIVATASIVSATVTFCAVCVALFREELRARFAPPRLELMLLPPEERPSTELRPERRKYRHLRVVNHRRTALVRNVRVFLLEIREKGSSKGHWTGEVPMAWRFESVAPFFQRTIGAPADCDLCSVAAPPEDQDGRTDAAGELRLETVWTRSHGAGGRAGGTYVLLLVARGDEADSNLLEVEIRWDGKWDARSLAFAEHLQIEARQV